MNKILNFIVFSLLLSLFACNQENIEPPQNEESLINLNVEVFSLAEYEAGIENVASTRGGKKSVAVSLDGQVAAIPGGPSTNLIIVCYGAPASDPSAQCIGINGTDSCDDVNCSENCYCYD